MTKSTTDTSKSIRRSPFFWPGVGFFFAALIGGGSFYGAMLQTEQLKQEHLAQKSKLDHARRRYQAAIEEVEISRTYLDRFNALQSQQLVGPIDRLAWSDGLKEIGGSLLLQGLSLEFSARQELSRKMKQTFEAREPIFHSFGMKLTFRSQHEEDLLRLLSRLDEMISPLYFVRHCQLSSRFATDRRPAYSDQGNVDISCELQLLQVVPRERG